ncbi:MAG TPA: hypothetical protein VGA78_03005 [Gemmatimonadales bacterium]
MSAIRTLLSHAIDYAGLFPPAGLGMREVVTNYAEYRNSVAAWALGRLVVPAARLDEFLQVARPLLSQTGDRWRLSAIASEDVRNQLAAVSRFNEQDSGAAVDCFEFRAGDLASFRELAGMGPFGFRRFAELPWGQLAAGYVTLMQSTLVGAKFRTGGVVPEAFPDPDALMQQLGDVIQGGVAVKCTAGLHHVVRGRYRLTYQADSPQSMMYGYLNLMLAAAALRMGVDPGIAKAVLLEEDPAAFVIEPAAVRWRELHFAAPVLSMMRDEGSLAFGSCSFTEPLDELGRIPVA